MCVAASCVIAMSPSAKCASVPDSTGRFRTRFAVSLSIAVNWAVWPARVNVSSPTSDTTRTDGASATFSIASTSIPGAKSLTTTRSALSARDTELAHRRVRGRAEHRDGRDHPEPQHERQRPARSRGAGLSETLVPATDPGRAGPPGQRAEHPEQSQA